MEMMSVSLIIPFMNAVMKPDEVMSNTMVSFFCNLFGIGSYTVFLVVLALIMAAIYILKNIFLLFQLSIQNRFVFRNMFDTQQRLLHNYLMRPYEYFLNIKSGEVLRIVSTDTSSTFNILTTLLQLFTELVVSTVLIITVFFVVPNVTLGIAALLLIMILLIQIILRPILRKAGIKNRDSFAQMNQWLLQAIQGIKEVKVMEKEHFFEESFAENGRIYVKTTNQNATFGSVPRFMLEAISMAAFFIVVAVMIYGGTELEDIVPMLSAVAMAAIRLLPSANRISQSMSILAFGETALDKMLENLREINDYNLSQKPYFAFADNKEIKRFEQEIRFQNVDYKYPSGKEVLKNASMVIRKGDSVGIVGASGAGKTTTVDLMLGLLQPNNGAIYIDGMNMLSNLHGWLNQIAYIPQTIFMLDGNVRENVAFGVSKNEIDDDKVWSALHEAAVDHDVKEFPDVLDTQLGERGLRLSGGQRQRIGIARALYTNPEILFFDEATSALDNETESEIMKSIEKLHGAKTMIIIAHRLTTIEGCDHIFRVEEGKIVQER